jgi:hypothetical protein
MKRHAAWAVYALAALALGAAGVWFVRHTEWVDEEVPVRPRPGAPRDELEAAKRVVAKLGARVVEPENLDRLPPAGATLLLSSSHSIVFPGRAASLRSWVEGGGHLVLDSVLLADDDSLAWVPVRSKTAAAAASAPAAPPPRNLPACATLQEPDSVAPAFGAAREFRICHRVPHALYSFVPASWALDGELGREFVRVPVGRGRVTVSASGPIFGNRSIFEADHALVLVAALRLRAGDEVWFVAAESRPPLPVAVWNAGAPAVLLGALALVLALWRGAARFGPPVPTAPPWRRSMAEQIRGTADFIFRRDGSALHRAQLRALDDAARRRLPGHDRLTAAARAGAIARATALDAAELAPAMDPSLPRTRRELAAALALLETAVRRLASHRSR